MSAGITIMIMWEEAIGFYDTYLMTSDCKTSLGLRTVNIKDHLVERENIEPGALVPGGIQRDSHCILLQQGRESLVDGKIFV